MIVNAGCVQQHLANVGVFVTDANVFVHHALTGFFAHHVPFFGFGEGIRNEKRVTILLIHRLLLGGRALGVIRRSRVAKVRIRRLHVQADAGLQQTAGHLLHFNRRRAFAPQQQIGVEFHANRAIGISRDAGRSFFHHLGELFTQIFAGRQWQASPFRRRFERHILHK